MKESILTHLPDNSKAIVLAFLSDQIEWTVIQKIAGIRTKPDFEAKFKEVLVLYHPSLDRKVFLLGLGEKKNLPKASLAFRSLVFHHHQKLENELCVDLSHLPSVYGLHASMGIYLSLYSPSSLKTSDEPRSPLLNPDFALSFVHSENITEQVEEGRITAETQSHIMHLMDSPPNHKRPTDLAAYVKSSAKQYGYQASILDKDALTKLGMHALLAVGQGSAHPPVMMIMEYKSEAISSDTPQLGLVGKGITFDTGGISMKRPTNMHYMKSDMGGASAVIGAIELAARLKLPIHVVGIVPSAENSVDANSILPGDVINSYSGKTIEVIDTDAEGRLILADGLAYMQEKYAPPTIIDLATLTGSSVMALGYAAGAMFTANDELADALSEAGFRSHERVWRLPIWEDYKDALPSDVADVKNFSGKPIAGAIYAAKFLEFFIQDHPRWAHLDIAGVAFGDSEFTKMKASTGYGVRLLGEFMKML